MCGASDVLHGVLEQKHGSFLRLFYPSKGHDLDHDELLKKQTNWFPRSEYSKGLISFVNLPAWIFGTLVHWTIGHVRIPAIQNLPLLPSTDGNKLPCIVFSHGLGANRLMYSTYCCELASHGCLVAIVEHRDKSASATYVLRGNKGEEKLVEEWIPFYKRTPSDDEFQLRNTQLQQRQDECMSAMNILEQLNEGTVPENLIKDQEFDFAQFKCQLDMEKTAIIGHSFGGATAVGTLAKDKRFRCCVALDVWMMPLGNNIHEQEINQPIFFINTYQFHKWKQNVIELKKLIQGKPETRSVISVRSHQLDSRTADTLYKKAIWAFLGRHIDIGSPSKYESFLDGGDEVPEHVIMGFEENTKGSAQL